MGKNVIKFVLIGAVWIAAATAAERQQEIKITASQPTHYYYTPMAKVNPPYHLVVSLHEMSFSFPDHLQVQASIFDNIGRINFGAKYGITDNLSVGAGLAHSFLTVDRGHGILKEYAPRFGTFLCYEFVETLKYEAAVTPHMQLFDHNSFGCDLGGMVKPSDFWSIIWEVGTSYDVNDHKDSTSGGFYFNTDGGLRIHPPAIPFLSFDGGIDVQEFKVNAPNPGTRATIYFDAIFSLVVKQ